MSHVAQSDALDWTRSMLQGRIISELFSERVQHFVLKGGMAMKLRHQNARATQDIDLDSLETELVDIQKLVRRAIARATSDNILEGVTVSEPKQTETTARWRIKGFDPKTRQMLLLTVEISQRDSISKDDVGVVPVVHKHQEKNILVYTNKALAFKKIKALLSPSREAPRDVSDLYLLIKGEVEAPFEALQSLLPRDVEEIVGNMWRKIESMDTARFKSEVLPSLPATKQAQELYQNWDGIRIQVGVKLEEWIRHAHKMKMDESENQTPAQKNSGKARHA